MPDAASIRRKRSSGRVASLASLSSGSHASGGVDGSGPGPAGGWVDMPSPCRRARRPDGGPPIPVLQRRGAAPFVRAAGALSHPAAAPPGDLGAVWRRPRGGACRRARRRRAGAARPRGTWPRRRSATRGARRGRRPPARAPLGAPRPGRASPPRSAGTTARGPRAARGTPRRARGRPGTPRSRAARHRSSRTRRSRRSRAPGARRGSCSARRRGGGTARRRPCRRRTPPRRRRAAPRSRAPRTARSRGRDRAVASPSMMPRPGRWTRPVFSG